MNPAPDSIHGIWQVAAQFGFNAVLIVWLLYYGKGALRELTAALDRMALAVTHVVLAMSFLPKTFHEESEKLRAEITEAKSKREK